MVSEGETVKVRIIHIDPERRRMGLSMKQVEDVENWSEYQEESEQTESEDSAGDDAA